jgi:hypothetical protein
MTCLVKFGVIERT